GDLGRKDALFFQGNKTFTKDQVLRALAWQMDYHLAAHPAGSLTNYLAQMERKISLGYQRAGFPDVSVKATAKTSAHRIVIEVSEGPRYRCGEVALSGARTMTNETVRRKISDAVGGLVPGAS